MRASRPSSAKSSPPGSRYWIAHHQKAAANHSTYVATINPGNCNLVAHFLKMDRYYTGLEGACASSVTSFKVRLDGTLGPPA